MIQIKSEVEVKCRKFDKKEELRGKERSCGIQLGSCSITLQKKKNFIINLKKIKEYILIALLQILHDLEKFP